MSKPILRDPSEDLPVASDARQDRLPIADRRPADAEMARVLQDHTTPHGFGPVQWRDRPLET